ncbi:MAG: Txe/YoeB family addiction module toxin [Prevotellaceae bacterium]|nr:Txe/YoeB family addiction module toxin [Prevotellaceae bacterium]
MTYKIEFSNEATEDLKRLNASEPKCFEKAVRFINEIAEHPRSGTGHPERLKHYELETWSRQISKKHRLVYRIYEDVVTVMLVSAFGHYDDK